MSLITRPLLSGSLKNFSKIKFPVIGTPKLDGIRALVIDGKLVSRNFKPIPNNFTRHFFESTLSDGMDGELMLASPKSSNGKSIVIEEGEIYLPPQEVDFNKIQSAVMKHDGTPEVEFHIFDWVTDSLEEPYIDRLKKIEKWYSLGARDRVKIVQQKLINNEQELIAYEEECLALGYEGIMVRQPLSKYKCGRSTENEGILLKIKKFLDAEAVVIGFKEKMTNENTKEKDAFGKTKRSSKKDGMVPAGTLGTVLVRDPKSGIEFGVGSGFNDEMREEIWNNQDEYLGKYLKYKYQELSKDNVPRFPVYLGFRHEDDM